MPAKVIIFSAPSGSGKSTIINALMERGQLNMQFSISATNRPPRGQEQHGVEYYFLSTEEFQQAIAANQFLEHEEVYPGRYYGTLRSEIDRIGQLQSNVVLDIDVNGALRVKQLLGEQALALFIQPPSVEELRRRLENRQTDSAESIATRIERAEYELAQAPHFDVSIINDSLADAIEATEQAIKQFLNA